ncbi:hypothetical protein QJS04_geneDACA020347 [Acorus gramineus]|uniref:Uncharacterized protein n=1 Tax=Acorus gramineus TaxID=55184 RepID=A0AAV9ABR6_ACOGR|nr:hypothetical protein QJS04_geneDACA020347 [Acorus gramineus]
MNNALLTKWVCKWLSRRASLWLQVMKDRYGGAIIGERRCPMLNAHASHIFKGIFVEQQVVTRAFGWQVRRGDAVHFWSHRWSSMERLGDLAHNIHRIAISTKGMVRNFYHQTDNAGSWNISLTRGRLSIEETRQYAAMMERLYDFALNSDREDKLTWRPTGVSAFSVKGGYLVV